MTENKKTLPTPELFRLNGKVAMITGASGLLGEQYAWAFAECGASIVLTDLYPAGAEALADRVRAQTKADVLVLACDVTQRSSWDEALSGSLDRFGKVDVLINNAAFTNQCRTPNFSAPFEEFPLEDWKAILDVNLTGTFLGCQIVGAQMLKRGAGSIINIGSLYGVVSPHHPMYNGTGIVQPPAYSVSKAGVIGLTRYLAALWAKRGVRVNCITPGGVFNNHPESFVSRFNRLSPMGRMSWKEELRGAAVYLASDASSHCIGHNLVVDGGWTIW